MAQRSERNFSGRVARRIGKTRVHRWRFFPPSSRLRDDYSAHYSLCTFAPSYFCFTRSPADTVEKVQRDREPDGKESNE